MTSSRRTPFDIMQDITGSHWQPGDGPSPTIGSWLQAVGEGYTEMAAYCHAASQMAYFEWCGLTVGYCMAMAGFAPVFGSIDVKRFLYATAWLGWGNKVEAGEIRTGDVVVIDWGSGHHHVTMFERDMGNGLWACRGGNQKNEVKISNFPSANVMGVRRISGAASPFDGLVAKASFDAADLIASASVAGSVFSGAGKPLTQVALEDAAERLGVGVAEIWALALTETEAPYSGFYRDKRPQILFERHIFSRLTKGRFDGAAPDISNPLSGGYGAGGAHQYDRLARAMALDEDAALQSASWGIGQVLGRNFKEAGFDTPQSLVRAAFESEDEQLAAVVAEIHSGRAAKALAAHDWAAFAHSYNGPGYAKNNYDTTLRTHYDRFRNGASPNVRIRAAQIFLMYLGHNPSDIDGSWGKWTRSAMNEYQAAKGLPTTDELDDKTFDALAADGMAVPGEGLRAADAALVA